MAQRRHRHGHRDDRDLRQGAQAQPDRQGRAGRHRRRLRCSSAASPTARSASFEATRYARGHKALYTFEINGEHASINWDLHDLHRLQYFDHRDEGTLRGWRSIHITDGDHPYMSHWWVPGLQIGYEHTFVHQVADFLDGLVVRQAAGADVPRRARHRPGDGRGAALRAERPVGAALKPGQFHNLNAGPQHRFSTKAAAAGPKGPRRGLKEKQTGTTEMLLGFNMLLWSTHVTEEHFSLFAKIKRAGFDGVELPIFEGTPEHFRKDWQGDP